MNSGGRFIASEAERSRGVGARMDVGLVFLGAAIGVTSVRLDVFGRGLEEAEREGFDGRDKAGFAADLSDGISPVGAATGAGLGLATEGCEGGRVIGLFTREPKPTSVSEWSPIGDSHPPVLSLVGDPQPPLSQSPLFWDGKPDPTTALFAVEVDCIRLVACG